LFTKAHPICHSINEVTKTSSHLDVAIGFSTGDLIWYDPYSNKYARLNKNGIIHNNVAWDIKWIPGSENLFLVAHGDGSLIVYDKEKDDAIYIPDEEADANGSLDKPSMLRVFKSVSSKNQKTNPVAWWKLGQQINAFSFSPDGSLIAVVCEDGTLRILDYVSERLLDVFRSYFGGFLCVCWSPDGRFIVTGGQDDLVTIWSVAEKRILARCQGHNAWVKGVAFDPWKCEGLNYRFGTIGEDRRLLLWDFNPALVFRPRNKRQRSASTASALPGVGDDKHGSIHTVVSAHAVEGKAETAFLPPVMVSFITNEIQTSMWYT
jgi:WD40 repeat protein